MDSREQNTIGTYGLLDNVHPLPVTYHIILATLDDDFFTTPRKCNNLAYLIFETAALHGYSLFAFCILPQQVHLLCRPGNLLVSHFVNLLRFRYEHVMAKLGLGSRVWQRQFDEYQLCAEEVIEKALYIFDAPVETGLVESAVAYPFSFVLGGKDYVP
ncbi:MAG: hypothetical protein Q8J63_03930 [Candidatus Aquicultor sp.]|nr:hypothetical protein [Candidatus Aquicultor sp.]